MFSLLFYIYSENRYECHAKCLILLTICRQYLKITSAPRLVHCHLPYHLMERQITESRMKVVVCLRNVKDVLVSYYECYKILDGWGDFSGTWDEFFKMFMTNNVAYGNYFVWVTQYWQGAKTNDKILIVKCEDLKKSPHKEIRLHKIDSMFYLSSRIQFGPNSGKKHTKLFFRFSLIDLESL